MKLVVAALAIAYPFLAHYAVASGNRAALVASTAALVLVAVLPGIARGSRVAWVGLLAASAGFYALSRADALQLVLYAPPVLITGLLAWVFGRTLVAGRTPLIEQLVRALHPPDDPVLDTIGPYTRRLTQLWAALLATIATINLVLALIAKPGGILATFGIDAGVSVTQETWSLFANFINYLVIAVLFAVEYVYRRRVFPQQPYRNFADFAQRVARAGPAVFRGR